MGNIKNLKSRLNWCNDRRHWTECEPEMEDLDEEINILETIINAFEWDFDAKEDEI